MFGRWFLSVLAATVASATISDCGPGRWPIDQLAFHPDPPTPGQDAVVTMIYFVPEGEKLDTGVASYTYTLNGLPLSPSENDLCKDIACPVVGRAEPFNQTTVSVWPQVSGKIETVMEWKDDVGELLLCMKVVARVAEQKAVWRAWNWFRENYAQA